MSLHETNGIIKMKHCILIWVVLAMISCNNTSVQQKDRNKDALHEQDSICDSTAHVPGRSLNDIRFKNWTDKDWYDNDYFRELRKYLDACYQGEIVDKNLEPYKSALRGQFAILNASPYISGGMFVSIVFLEAPNKIFDVGIYSDVDEDTETIVDYHVRGVIPREDEESGLTKNDILTIIKEHPENKLW
jgi:hypothetical protein